MYFLVLCSLNEYVFYAAGLYKLYHRNFVPFNSLNWPNDDDSKLIQAKNIHSAHLLQHSSIFMFCI